VLLAVGTACTVTSNVIFYHILNEVNYRRSHERQFGFIFVNVRAYEIIREHARLFPDSQKRKLMYLWIGVGLALFLMVFFSALPVRLHTGLDKNETR